MVRWLLSVDASDLAKFVRENNKSTFRLVSVIVFGLTDAVGAIEIVSTIRNSVPVGFKGD